MLMPLAMITAGILMGGAAAPIDVSIATIAAVSMFGTPTVRSRTTATSPVLRTAAVPIPVTIPGKNRSNVMRQKRMTGRSRNVVRMS
jgi:hypothetical protein